MIRKIDVKIMFKSSKVQEYFISCSILTKQIFHTIHIIYTTCLEHIK